MTSRSFNHIGQCVADLARSEAFYVGALGFERTYEISPDDGPTAQLLGLAPPVGLTAVYLRLDNFVLELLAYRDAAVVERPPRVMNEPGLTHLSVSVSDLDETKRAVLAFGGTVQRDTDVGAAVFVRDPDGQLVELLPASFAESRPD